VQGEFTYEQILSPLAAQEHIRRWGAVVTGLQLFNNTRDFFAKKGAGVYRPGRGATKAEVHAVAVVGYNNKEKSWLAMNSWGAGFGEAGFMKVRGLDVE
jgi:C1A family cysteine protease